MKLERLKSIVLFCLVAISIVLTTQIWLNISIEGIFIMSKNKEYKNNELLSSDNDKASFIKPEKLIINNNGKHTLLFNETEAGMIYDRILDDMKNMLSVVFEAKEGMELEKRTLDYMEKLRAGRSVELQLPFAYDYKLLAGILGINNPNWQEIKKVDAVVVGYDSNNVYIVDKGDESIYEFRSKSLRSSIRVMVDMINRGKPYSYIFLNDIDSERYSDAVFIPVDIDKHSMPKLSSYSETDIYTIEDIAKYFFEDPTTLRSIVDPSGTVIYTDGENQGIRISKSGVIEYVKYSISSKNDGGNFTALDAVNIATNFVNSHMGFPKDSYISSIEQTTINNKLYSCVIRYNYRYEGIPIVNDDVTMDNPIEVEIVNGQVKRYKRVVKNIKVTGSVMSVRKPLEIIDILFMRLNHDKKIEIDDIMIKDIYLSYLEYGINNPTSMIPVWVVEVQVDSSFNASGRFIMNAESGVILFEPY
ncbi:two-component system activity regulator YycH [Lutispora thermophila]|uniref:Two-component signal transduction system YycFG, regulatory protein YycH n=1 Tax=Lutispora thermophila DSM 19022 TaxID=1122184 RepID=A0A1M6GVT6_9FIRM|nr:two-component system activity regulator YycH [Lutispora thermophila]SHJ14063.1 Two-component signal transduction system YycFG, regulatory protein YycH [Lutispora thermophila DSM 19022]